VIILQSVDTNQITKIHSDGIQYPFLEDYKLTEGPSQQMLLDQGSTVDSDRLIILR